MSVPTALHAELSEYSFLLRALRTSNTLDVVSHLTNVPASKDEPDFEIQDVSNQGAPHEHTPEALGSVSNIKRKRKLRGGGLGTTSGKSRDTWTRWPLLADDVHVPEWGLEDEIKLLALHSLRQYSPHKFLDPSPEDAGTDADEDDILPPSTVKALTLSSSSHLSSILAIISAHIPLYEKGLQSRLKPVGWESVVDMMGASGLVDEKIVKNVKQRMEAIYGTSASSVVNKIQSKSLAKLMLDDLVSLHELSFLTLPPCTTYKRKGSSSDQRGGRRG